MRSAESNSGTLRVAAVQALTCPDPDENVARMETFFKQARRRKVQVICFPEAYISFYDFVSIRGRDPEYARKIESGIQGTRELAQSYEMWCVVGTITPKRGKWSNDAYLITPTGKIRGIYTKIFTLDGERKLVAQGKELPTFKIGDAQVGIQICNDQKHPEGWQVLAQKNCDVVFHPMFGNGEKQLNLYENGAQMCRAWENGLYVVTANAISTKPGTNQFAISQIIGPDGKPLCQAEPEREELLVADLDLSRSSELRKRARRADRRQIFTMVKTI